MFAYKFEDFDIMVTISRHAKGRMYERKILEAPLYGSIVAATDKVLDLKSGEEFAIVDKETDVAIIARIDSRKDIIITVMTVIDCSNIWVRTNTKVIALEV